MKMMKVMNLLLPKKLSNVFNRIEDQFFFTLSYTILQLEYPIETCLVRKLLKKDKQKKILFSVHNYILILILLFYFTLLYLTNNSLKYASRCIFIDFVDFILFPPFFFLFYF